MVVAMPAMPINGVADVDGVVPAPSADKVDSRFHSLSIAVLLTSLLILCPPLKHFTDLDRLYIVC